jgi:hypothetical protein
MYASFGTQYHVSKGGPRPTGKKLYAMNMPFVETLEQARHFIKGSAAYEGAPSPWKDAIRSPQRPETMNGANEAPPAAEPGGRWLPL